MAKTEVLQKGNTPTVPVTWKETRDFYTGNRPAGARGGIATVEKALKDADAGGDGTNSEKGQSGSSVEAYRRKSVDPATNIDFFKK